MNPLQEHSHLFANGEFKIKDDEGNILKIWGFTKNPTNKNLSVFHVYEEIDDRLHHAVRPTDQCTLIARPIEDMTDEEWDKIINIGGRGGFTRSQRKGLVKRGIRNKTLYLNEFLYLLSIGVYPFNQSHFEDGTVIDSTTL